MRVVSFSQRFFSVFRTSARAHLWTIPIDKTHDRMPKITSGSLAGYLNVSLPFYNDVDVLRCLHDRVNEMRVLGGRTKAKRAEILNDQPKFDDYDRIEVSAFRISPRAHGIGPFDAGRWALYIGCKRLGYHPQCSEWSCRVFADDWSLWTGLSAWKVYDHSSLVPSRALVKWRAVRRRMLLWARAAALLLSILEEIELRPGNVGYRRVKARFEGMQNDV